MGTVIAAAPLLSDVPSLLAQSGRAAGRGGTAPKPLDPFLEYSVRELAAIQRRAHSTKAVRAEDARAAAQSLRAAVVYARGVNLDGTITGALRSAVDAQGRDAFVYPDVDPQRMVQDMRQFGAEMDGLPDTSGLDYAARAALLDDLLAGGITPALTRIADSLARAASELERRSAMAATPIVRVQDASWWTAYCSSLAQEMARLQAEANAVLLLAFFNPDVIGAYYLIEIAIGVDAAIYGLFC